MKIDLPQKFLSFILVSLVFCWTLSLFSTAVEAAWLTGWDYRKPHTIVGSSSGAQTDYQINVTVYNITGTDQGAMVYIDDKARPDFGDIRFTNSSGNLIDYWIEEIGSNYAKFWVEVPNIPANPNTETVYIYYGKSDETTTSDGPNTFLFFDHFSGASLDPQWDETTGTPTVGGGVLEYNQGDRIKSSGNFFLYPKRVRYRVRTTAGIEVGARSRIGLSSSNLASNFWADDAIYTQSPYDTNIRAIVANEGGTTGVNPQAMLLNQWYDLEIRWISWQGAFLVDDGPPSTINTNVPDENCYPRIECTATVNTITQVDWYFVANFADPEPTHGIWGSEELIGAPTIKQLSYEGDLNQMDIYWVTQYKEPSSSLVNVTCVLNNDTVNEQVCDPPPGLEGGGSCFLTSPSYDMARDGGELRTVENTLYCKACNDDNPNLCDERMESFRPLDFEVSLPNAMGLVVGEKQDLGIIITNNGLLTDNYSVNAVSSDPGSLLVEDGSQSIELLETKSSERVNVGITLLNSQSTPTADVTVTSEISNLPPYPLISFNQIVNIEGTDKSLPDFGLFGILQIMIIAALLVSFLF